MDEIREPELLAFYEKLKKGIDTEKNDTEKQSGKAADSILASPIVMVQSESRPKLKKDINVYFIAILLAFIIEWSAALDFYSDTVVVSELA